VTVAVARIAAHNAFDPLWQSGRLSRTAAYNWLALQMGLRMDQCHIKLLDEKQCQRVIELCGPMAFDDLDA
jgi:hypothetical protein